MDAQNMQKAPAVMKESKNKIKVDFERTPLKERLKAKYLSTFFLQKAIWYIFRLVLLIGISYIVLYPFISKIMTSFTPGHAGKEGPQLARTGASQGFPRAAAPVGVFSRGTTRISGSLSCGAREVRSPCAWRGGARPGSRVTGGD